MPSATRWRLRGGRSCRFLAPKVEVFQPARKESLGAIGQLKKWVVFFLYCNWGRFSGLWTFQTLLKEQRILVDVLDFVKTMALDSNMASEGERVFNPRAFQCLLLLKLETIARGK